MQNAYSSSLIPIVTFRTDSACAYSPTNQNTDWAWAMALFAWYMPSMDMPIPGSTQLLYDPPMLFEIGNEPNETKANPNASANWNTFPRWFAQAAQSLNVYLSSLSNGTGRQSYSHYKVITGAVSAPAAADSCDTLYPSQIGQLTQALATALTSETNPDPSWPVYLPGMNSAHLAVGSHPYGYSTTASFGNFYGQGGPYGGVCQDLGQYMTNWAWNWFYGFTDYATEDNYSSLPKDQPLPDYHVATNLEGAYMIDLFSWLYWNLGADGQWGYSHNNIRGERGYPFNLMWWNGLDDNGAGVLLGLYARSPTNPPSAAVDKPITFTPNCPYEPYIQQNSYLSSIMAFMDRAGGGTYSGDHC